LYPGSREEALAALLLAPNPEIMSGKGAFSQEGGVFVDN
jgi:hypothetical protein